jgi:hypothetical protein
MYVCTYVNKIYSKCRKQWREKRAAHKVLVRKHKEGYQVEDAGIAGMIMKWRLNMT